MVNELRPKPVYVDGVKNLHKQFEQSFNKAIEMAMQFVPMNDTIRKRLKDRSNITLYVDFSQPSVNNTVKAYLVIGLSRIVRFINFSIDIVALFPSSDHNGDKNKSGLSYEKILELQRERKGVLIRFIKDKESYQDNHIFDIKVHKRSWMSEDFDTLDDLGNPFYKFPDIQKLKLIEVPEKFLNKSFSLVGKQFYAPLTTNKESYCVLFAELNNQYDTKAIRVLRWFPISRKEWEDNILLNKIDYPEIFYELGHISRLENEELHDFMTSNQSRLLFAKLNEGKIKILGGVKMFLQNDFHYPLCLSKIPLS